jgi:hypothetical protein
MKLKHLLLITAVIYLINGITSVIYPSLQLSVYNLFSDKELNYMAQWAGLGSVVVGLVAISGMKITDHSAQRQVILTLFIYFAAAALLSLSGSIAGIMGSAGWVLTVFNILFLIGYSYFLFKNSAWEIKSPAL